MLFKPASSLFAAVIANAFGIGALLGMLVGMGYESEPWAFALAACLLVFCNCIVILYRQVPKMMDSYEKFGYADQRFIMPFFAVAAAGMGALASADIMLLRDLAGFAMMGCAIFFVGMWFWSKRKCQSLPSAATPSAEE